MIRCEVEFEIARRPEDVFAFVDELRNAPRWLARCIDLQQTSPPPKGVGTTLRYFYREAGGREGEMEGVVIEYEKGRRLKMKFSDPNLAIDMSLRFTPSELGTHGMHVAEVTPKTLITKLMTPVIRGTTQKQIENDAAKLKALLDPGPVAARTGP